MCQEGLDLLRGDDRTEHPQLAEEGRNSVIDLYGDNEESRGAGQEMAGGAHLCEMG